MSGHRRAVGTITMLLGMVVALTLLLAACGCSLFGHTHSPWCNRITMLHIEHS